jgi:hypothetical protein
VYRRLDPARIVDTADKLRSRISERFPDADLRHVADELVEVCQRAATDEDWFRRPHLWLRIAVGLVIGLLALVAAGTLVVVLPRPAGSSIADLVQLTEAALQDLVYLGVAIYFLTTLEGRRKRRRALTAIHELRAMAHIIDMHQLTKDPERVMGSGEGGDTPSSPVRSMTVFQLSRYLDYCSEMLSLLSKSAALYVQDFADAITLSAVNEVEDLCNGLSRKIWQKIMILDREIG